MSREPAPRIIAVASGKGGAGKSLLVSNLGIYLATLDKRVVLLDAAFGAANLHTFVGTREPGRGLSDMLADEAVSLDQVVVATSVPGMGIISGLRDPAWAANPTSAQLTRLRENIGRLSADYVVIDLGPGTTGATLDLWLMADAKVLVLTPEPTSIELAYRFLRAAFVRRLHQLSLIGRVHIPEGELRELAGGIPAPSDYLRHAAQQGDDGLARQIEHEIAALRPGVLFNLVRSRPDMTLGPALCRAAGRQLGLQIRDLGFVEYDDAVWVSLRRGRPLLIEHPEARASKGIEKVTRRLLSRADRTGDAERCDNHYDLFEIQPTATNEEIRRANRRVRETYAHDSVVIAGLYTQRQLDALHERLDRAYETLMDSVARAKYDHDQFPDGIPTPPPTQPSLVAQVSKPPPVGERPDMPDLSADTEYTGSLMQEVRLARGLDLREISERTKIGMSYLAAIEEELWNKLPAVVYVRGFLVEYSRMLSLDVGRVLDTYLERYRQATAE